MTKKINLETLNMQENKYQTKLNSERLVKTQNKLKQQLKAIGS